MLGAGLSVPEIATRRGVNVSAAQDMELPMAIKFTPEDNAAVAGQDTIFSFPFPVTIDPAGAVLGARVGPTGGNALANWSVNGVSILDQPARLIPGQLEATLVPQILTGVIPGRVIPAGASQRMWLVSAPAGSNAGQGYFFSPVWAKGLYVPKSFLPAIYSPAANMPGVQVWLDIGDQGTLTLSAGPGSTITQAVDKIAGYVFAFETSAPAHVVAGIGARDAMAINSNLLVCNAAAASNWADGVNTPWTAGMVVRPGHNSSSRFALTVGSGSATGDAAIRIGTNVTAYQVTRGDANFATSRSAQEGTGTVQTVNPVVLAATFDGTTMDLYVDGVLAAREAAASFANTITNGVVAVGAGRHLATAANWWSNTGAARINEMLLGSQALAGAPASIGQQPTAGSDLRKMIDYLRINAGQI